MALDPGSFRDPDSRVFLTDEGVYRAPRRRGRDDWLRLREASVFARGDRGRHARGDRGGRARRRAGACGEPALAAVLRHERVPFISYPYEWTFGMLRDAALLQLDLLERALAEGADAQGQLALQRAVARRRARCSSTSARSSGCARVSRGSATGSSACCSSIR